jgi:DNA-binding CsgD family transcriptional regulator
VRTGREAPHAVVAFFADIHAAVLGADPRVRVLGPGRRAMDHFTAVAPATRHSVWNMQPIISLPSLRDGLGLNAENRARGVDLRFVVPPAAVRRDPFLVNFGDPLRVGPVPHPLLVVDGEIAFVAGPDGTALAGTLWETRDPGLCARAVEAYRQVWEAAAPIEEVATARPLPDRTFEVALRLLDGANDREIAEELGVSERTVSGEVRRIIDWTGARSRAHAIARLVGSGS